MAGVRQHHSSHHDWNYMSDWLRRHWVGIAATAVILAVLGTIIWLGVGYYLDVWNQFVRFTTRKFFVRELFPSLNPLRWTPFAYMVATFFFAFTAFVVGDMKSRRGLAFLMSLCLLFGAYTVTGLWENDKNEARSYASDTTFVVEDPNKLPASLSPLIEGAKRSTSGADCLFSKSHDVGNCITQGSLPANWENRAASLTGASIVMSRTSGAVPNTDIMQETLTYQNDSSTWTAIRNGRNKQPVYGVVSWDGSNAVQTCRFTGSHALNYAFGGKWGQNLDDTLAKDFPALLYTHDDMWGFCRGAGEITAREPVIVIPVTEQQSYGRRTTLRSAGVLVITGTPSGEPKIEHRTSVKAGDFPGPVYPPSLVAKQREMLQWAAGRGNKNRLNFGFEPSNVAAQNGNDSEYLLRDMDTGRLFWVTPLKPRSTDSQLLVAYSLTYADEAGTGTLNEQKIYVLPDEDRRIVNVDDMEARVSQAIRDKKPGFFTGAKPGKVSEFLPVNRNTWQAFAEINGRVDSKIEVPTDSHITPVVQNLDGTSDATPSATPSICTKSIAEMTDSEIADCIAQFAKELAGRK